jgi:hypothetical protein
MVTKAKPAIAAWVLGLAGAVPFVATSAGYCLGPSTVRGPMSLALLAYAGVILSFLGGARWGMELVRHSPPRAVVLFPSVVPSLIAWALLVGAAWVPLKWQLVGFIGAYLAQWLWDNSSPETPEWYAPLRTVLTLIAGVSMAFVLQEVWRA